ncbi:MAG: translation initiation factor IF-2, partial [Chitinophagaceae bacterium]
MSESNTPRLMAAAKEFNIGKDTLVDFLVSKGFSKDDLKPTSKLTEDMYHSLQQEFSSDKAAKAKSDAIEIPKGAATEAKKKKDAEEIVFKKDTKKKAEPVEAEEPKPVEVAPPPAEVTKIEAPELGGPKILDKIDLDALDSSTRPKKGQSKKKEKVAEEKEEVKETVNEEQVAETPAESAP